MGEDKRRALAQAAERVSLDELALWLGASVPSIRAWMMGIVAMPERKLALVIDLLHKLGDRPPPAGNVYPLRLRRPFPPRSGC